MSRDLDVGRLHVHVGGSAWEMGARAASEVARRIRTLLEQQESVRAVFAAAPSQEGFIRVLIDEPGIDWGRVEVLQLDEFIGLEAASSASLRSWLLRTLTTRVPVIHAEYIDGSNPNLEGERARYEAIVRERPIDLGLIGIGENGHLGFNDPHAANLDDPQAVKVVELDEVTRRQEMRDGLFSDMSSVPLLAITMTMSTILSSRTLSVVVPGMQKARAVERALFGPVSAVCPASALRNHQDATLWVDNDAFSVVQREYAVLDGKTAVASVDARHE